MAARTNGRSAEVLGKVPLDEGDQPPVAPIKDIASLNQRLPTLCTRIFERLGSQQLEATYQRCIAIDLGEAGVKVELEPELLLTYKGKVVGTRRADVLLQLASGERAILELKVVDEMQLPHRKQLEYYLHHSNVDQGYLINFPHDSSFPAVDDQSDFTVSLLVGLLKKVQHLLTGGPSLRLRNAKRQVEVLQVTRKAMTAAEREEANQAKLNAPVPRFGIKTNGEECSICIRQGRFCHLHEDQKPKALTAS